MRWDGESSESVYERCGLVLKATGVQVRVKLGGKFYSGLYKRTTVRT